MSDWIEWKWTPEKPCTDDWLNSGSRRDNFRFVFWFFVFMAVAFVSMMWSVIQ